MGRRREKVREEARQRRQVYAERMVPQSSRNLVKPGPIGSGDLVMLQGTAVAKEKGLKFYYRWTGPYLVHSVSRGGMSFVLRHPHHDKAQGGACNEPPPRGLRTGKLGKMYAAMIYIGRMRVGPRPALGSMSGTFAISFRRP